MSGALPLAAAWVLRDEYLTSRDFPDEQARQWANQRFDAACAMVAALGYANSTTEAFFAVAKAIDALGEAPANIDAYEAFTAADGITSLRNTNPYFAYLEAAAQAVITALTPRTKEATVVLPPLPGVRRDERGQLWVGQEMFDAEPGMQEQLRTDALERWAVADYLDAESDPEVGPGD